MGRRHHLWQIGLSSDVKISISKSHHHKNAFYTLLKHYFDSHDYTTILLTKAEYDKICQFCIDLIDGSDAWTKKLEGNLQGYEWERKYNGVVSGEMAVLVLCLDTAVDVGSMNLSSLRQPTYAEKVWCTPKCIKK